MKLPAPRTLLRLLIGVAVPGLLVWFALQEPAQLAHVERVRHGPITRQFAEEGKTRLKARYVLSAPVAGTLLRIDLEPGDTVHAGQVLARIAPATSALLDASSRARAEADMAAGLAQQNAARERIRSARANWKLALASRDRARALRPGNAISQEALEQAEARARRSLADLRGAQADEAAAAQRVIAARAVLAQEGQAHRHDDDPAPANRSGIVTVVAPISGVILKRDQQSEMPVTAGQRLMEIGDITQLDIEAELLSTDAMTLKPGMPARVLRWGGDGVLDARISRIEPGAFTKVSALGVEEQRTRVLLDITTPREQWATLGDAYRVELEFIQQHLDEALQVPAGALFRLTGKQRQQLVNSGQDEAEKTGIHNAASPNIASSDHAPQGTGEKKPGDTAAPASANRSAPIPPDEPQWAVYRVEDGRARLTPVRVGLRSGTAAQILEGLSEGDAIIIQPDDRIQDGTRIAAN